METWSLIVRFNAEIASEETSLLNYYYPSPRTTVCALQFLTNRCVFAAKPGLLFLLSVGWLAFVRHRRSSWAHGLADGCLMKMQTISQQTISNDVIDRADGQVYGKSLHHTMEISCGVVVVEVEANVKSKGKWTNCGERNCKKSKRLNNKRRLWFDTNSFFSDAFYQFIKCLLKFFSVDKKFGKGLKQHSKAIYEGVQTSSSSLPSTSKKNTGCFMLTDNNARRCW